MPTWLVKTPRQVAHDMLSRVKANDAPNRLEESPTDILFDYALDLLGVPSNNTEGRDYCFNLWDATIHEKGGTVENYIHDIEDFVKCLKGE